VWRRKRNEKVWYLCRYFLSNLKANYKVCTSKKGNKTNTYIPTKEKTRKLLSFRQ
jgi:hypothetical protein